MDIGIGLPNTVPGTEGRRLLDWAKNPEEAGFSTLGTMVQGYADAFASAGCDELIFIPTTAAPDQIGLLASAVL